MSVLGQEWYRPMDINMSCSHKVEYLGILIKKGLVESRFRSDTPKGIYKEYRLVGHNFKGISTKVNLDETKRKSRGLSIYKCLTILGAKEDEVYSSGKNYSKLLGKSNQTIYQRYTKDDLLYWATNLHKKAISKYHPDRFVDSKDKKIVEEKATEINVAFQRIKHILRKKQLWH